jgi:4-amino-4-deoxy-L-arabinose transferase
MTMNRGETKSAAERRLYLHLPWVLFLLLYLLPLGARDLFVPDETRYAEIPREMIASGDWIVPRLNGVRYFEKPPLGYWIHAGSQLLFGENNFAVRLPSAMAAGLSALLIFGLVSGSIRRGAGSEPESKPDSDLDSDLDLDSNLGWPAALAAFVFLTSFEVFGVGHVAVLDNLFSFFTAATVAAFFLATETPRGSAKENGFLLLAGVSCGLAFLTKGFLALAVPTLTLGPYLIWQRRFRDIASMGVRAVLVAVLTALPWSIAIHHREPDFWNFFFWNEHIRRFAAEDAQHGRPFWFYFAAAPGLFLPWTFAAPALAGMRTEFRDLAPSADPARRLIRLCLCWLIVPFLFFSVAKGKLVTYILPCFPPFAILLALTLGRGMDDRAKRVFHRGAACFGLLFAMLLAAFAFLQIFGFRGFRPFASSWKLMLAAAGLGFVPLLCHLSVQASDVRTKLLRFGLAPSLLFAVANWILPAQTLEVKAPGPFLESFQDLGADVRLVSDESSFRAVCWYLRRDDVYLLEGDGELEYGLGHADAAGRLLDLDAFGRLVERNPGRVALVVRTKKTARWGDRLPVPVSRERSGPRGYVLWRY